VQRKVFRIEETFAVGRAAEQAPAVDELKALHKLAEQRDDAAAETVRGLTEELNRIRDTIARNKRELDMMIGDGTERRMFRAADELRASVDGMDYATQKILKSSEIIDDSARALAAAQKNDYEHGLAQEIQDQVVMIYEACNFQDLAGQRITSVIGIMTTIEDQVAAMLDRCNGIAVADKPAAIKSGDRALLNGPKLEGDAGHASQSDIDAMFN
jgi:chemotaxis protein CheZ